MMTILIIFAMIFVLGPIAQAYARRLNPPDVRGVKPGEIARLREEMEALAAQVNRLQDEQSFMLRLLSEGDRKAALRPPRPEPGAGEAHATEGPERPSS